VLVNLVFSAIVYIHSRRGLVETFFALLAFNVSLWSFATFLLISSNISFEIFKLGSALHWVSGTLIFWFFFWFAVFYSFRITKSFAIPILVSIANAFILLLVLSPSLFFEDFTAGAIALEEKIVFNLYGYAIFSVTVVSTFLLAEFYLLRKYRETHGPDRTRLTYLILGTFIAGSFGLLFNLLLPGVGNFGFFSLGPIIATPLFVGVLIYAILRYKLFSLRVIAAEIFTTLLVILMATNLFLSDTRSEFAINGFILIIASIFGYLLIRSVFQEVRTRERVEKLARDLAVANERLKELDQRKSEFVSIASHQLRSPLTAIKGYASMLLEGSFGKLSEQAWEAVDKVFKSSNRLVDIIEDFLTISRIEQNRLKYEFRTVNLKEVVENIINELKPIVKDKKLDILLKVKDDRDYIITADPGKISQVVGNIIDNAIKYTPKGSITLTLSEDFDRHTVLLSITDTGIGMSRQAIDGIFQKFSRAKDAFKVSVKGVGLGLYVASQIVKAHRGRIWAESEGRGKGSTFYVELPAQE